MGHNNSKGHFYSCMPFSFSMGEGVSPGLGRGELQSYGMVIEGDDTARMPLDSVYNRSQEL